MSKAGTNFPKITATGRGWPEVRISVEANSEKSLVRYLGDALKTKAKKVLVGIAGGLILAAGIAMIVLPGPAFIVIPAGLALLATEFDWARRLEQRCEERFRQWREKHREKKARKRAAQTL